MVTNCGRMRSWPVEAAILAAAGPDVVREAGPDQIIDTRDPKKVLPLVPCEALST